MSSRHNLLALTRALPGGKWIATCKCGWRSEQNRQQRHSVRQWDEHCSQQDAASGTWTIRPPGAPAA